jgi:hypothetical protein
MTAKKEVIQQVVLRDTKGHFISQMNQGAVKQKPVVKAKAKTVAVKPVAKKAPIKHYAFKVQEAATASVSTKPRQKVPYVQTAITNGKIAGTSSTAVNNKTLYLWMDEKYQFRIAPYPQSYIPAGQQGLVKPLVALHDPKVNLISLKRAIRDAEDTYNLNNGITLK